MESSYNARCPAVKRLLKEAQELHEPTEEYYAHPIEDNLFEWHFTVRGPPETEFEGGVYHGRIIMPAEYPMKPPNIIFFTPNGRFETNQKICLSISGHHPETWQPSWSIRTALLAIIGFMPTPANGTIGALEYTAAERATLSRKSLDYLCTTCGRVGDLLKERTGNNAALQQEAKQVSSQMSVSGKKDDLQKGESDPKSRHGHSGVQPVDITSDPKPLTQSRHSAEAPSPSSGDTPEQSGTRSFEPSSSIGSVDAHTRSGTSSTPTSLALIANNILLSAAVFVLIALVLRRLFLLESWGASDEMEDLLL